MNLFKTITLKIKLLLRAKVAKKYGDYYAAQIHCVLTALFKVMKKADSTKVEPCINDANMIIKEIRDFAKNHGTFIKETIDQLIKELDTSAADKKMKDLIKTLEPIFTNK